MCECLVEGVESLFSVSGFQLAFPDDDDSPALGLQLSPLLLIALLVPDDLGLPEFRVGFGHGIVLATLVAVPEASVDEHHRPVLGQHDVRFPRQPLLIDPVAKPQTPQRTAQLQLRFRRRGVNLRHRIVAGPVSQCLPYQGMIA